MKLILFCLSRDLCCSQIHLYWHLHLWIYDQDTCPGILHWWLYIPSRSMELVGFQCHCYGVCCLQQECFRKHYYKNLAWVSEGQWTNTTYTAFYLMERKMQSYSLSSIVPKTYLFYYNIYILLFYKKNHTHDHYFFLNDRIKQPSSAKFLIMAFFSRLWSLVLAY